MASPFLALSYKINYKKIALQKSNVITQKENQVSNDFMYLVGALMVLPYLETLCLLMESDCLLEVTGDVL